jgi:outer membrane protein
MTAGSAIAADSLTDVYDQAVQKDPVLAQVQARTLATRETKAQARAALLPSITFDAYTTDNNQDIDSASAFGAAGKIDFNSNGYTLNLTQPLFRFDRWLALGQSDRIIEQAELELRAQEQALIVRVSERYFDALGAQDTLGFANATRDSLERQLNQVKQRFEVGMVATTDVQEAQAAYDLAVADVIIAENGVDSAFEALHEIIGSYPSTLLPLDAEIPLLAPTPNDIDAWTESALEGNLQIAVNRAAAATAEKEIKIQRAQHLPTVDVVGSYGDQSTGGRFGGTDTTFDTIGLQLEVPIFAGLGTRSRVKQAVYQHQASLDAVQQAQREAQRNVREAFHGVIAGASRVKALKQAVISSETAVEATRAGFEVGTRTTVDVVASERELFRANRDYARARYDYLVNFLRLKEAAGSLSEADLEAVNGLLVEPGASSP